jgi:hypothetical protein
MSRVLRPKTVLKISKSSEELFNIDFASVDFDFKGFKTYSEKKCPYVQKSPIT